MRLLRSLVWCVVFGGLGVIGLLFLVQNLHTERIGFFGLDATINFALVVLGAVAIGFLLALVLIVPGRIATALYARALERELGQVERQVAALSEQREQLLDGRERMLLRYERLFADHDRAIAERERMRAQLAAAVAATAAAAATATTARQPLALRERESGTGRGVSVAPVRFAPVALDERRSDGTLAAAGVSANASASASAAARSSRILPPVPTAPDPPAASHSPIILDQPEPPAPPAEPLIVPDSSPVAPDQQTDASAPDSSATPPVRSRASQMRERIARHTAAAREQLAQWQVQAGRVRRSAGARYNHMRMTLLVRARAAASSVRQFSAPSAPADRAAARTAARASSAASARDEDGRDEDGYEISTLKGEQSRWRPPE